MSEAFANVPQEPFELVDHPSLGFVWRANFYVPRPTALRVAVLRSYYGVSLPESVRKAAGIAQFQHREQFDEWAIVSGRLLSERVRTIPAPMVRPGDYDVSADITVDSKKFSVNVADDVKEAIQESTPASNLIGVSQLMGKSLEVYSECYEAIMGGNRVAGLLNHQLIELVLFEEEAQRATQLLQDGEL